MRPQALSDVPWDLRQCLARSCHHQWCRHLQPQSYQTDWEAILSQKVTMWLHCSVTGWSFSRTSVSIHLFIHLHLKRNSLMTTWHWQHVLP